MANPENLQRQYFYLLKADKNIPVESICLEKPYTLAIRRLLLFAEGK